MPPSVRICVFFPETPPPRCLATKKQQRRRGTCEPCVIESKNKTPPTYTHTRAPPCLPQCVVTECATSFPPTATARSTCRGCAKKRFFSSPQRHNKKRAVCHACAMRVCVRTQEMRLSKLLACARFVRARCVSVLVFCSARLALSHTHTLSLCRVHSLALSVFSPRIFRFPSRGAMRACTSPGSKTEGRTGALRTLCVGPCGQAAPRVRDREEKARASGRASEGISEG